jgi:cytochrome c oxidase subunit 2
MITPRSVALVGGLLGLGLLIACGSDGGASDVELSPVAAQGRDVIRSNGCAACHGRDGEGGVGPTFVGLFGRDVELDDGSTVVADRAYLVESIRDPQAKIVAGYRLPMPSNQLDDAQIDQVIAYIEELSTAGTAP